MRKVLTYDIADIVPYINWLYFFHAWGLSGKPAGEKEKMKQEALLMLKSWYGKYHTHASNCHNRFLQYFLFLSKGFLKTYCQGISL